MITLNNEQNYDDTEIIKTVVDKRLYDLLIVDYKNN